MKKFVICACLLSLAIAANLVKIEEDPRQGNLPFGWKSLGSAEGTQELKLTIALTQRNVEEFEKLFWEISTPDSAKFRKFLSFEEITGMLAPTDSDIQEVISWLRDSGVTAIELHHSKDFIIFETTVSFAEQLLATKYESFEHISGRRFTKAVGAYHAPSHIASKIDFISGFRLPDVKAGGKYKKSGQAHPSIAVNKYGINTNASTDNGPMIVYINPLDQVTSNTILPKCKNGQVYTSNSNVVTSICSGPSISGFYFNISQTRYPNQLVYFDLSQASCMPCNQSAGGFESDLNTFLPFSHFQTACNQSNVQFGYPPNTVYCELAVNNLKNYVETIFNVSTIYSDGSSSVAKIQNLTVFLSQFTTPQLLWNLYNIPYGIQATNPNTNMSVAEFLGQFYSPQDLSLFFQYMGLADRSSLVDVIGPNDASNPGGEATLDIQFIMGIAQGVPTTFWSLSQLNNGQEPFLDWIVDVINSQYPPLVHSISYGDDEDSLTEDFMTRVNVEFQKAGAMGVSLLFSSGDNGVYGGGMFGECDTWTPAFPASSPYVTTVGGTLLSTQTAPICEQNLYGLPIDCHLVGEVTSSTKIGSRISSGGGFSNIFARPAYQDAYVDTYIEKTLANVPQQYYKASGRAYPDIGALAHNFLTVIGGSIDPVDGTSAAAPTAAAIVTLLNDLNFNLDNGPLGFLNPWLYDVAATNSTAFRDIVMGDNSCSELAWICCPYGLSAAVGWDAVTGLGSLNYGVLANILKGF